SELVMVKGVTLEAQRRMQTGAGVRPPRFSGEGVSVGSLLAGRLELYAGQRVRLFSPELISAGLQALSQPELLPALSIGEARVESAFVLQQIFDDRYVLAPLSVGRTILLYGKEHYSGLDVRPQSGVSTEKLDRELRRWISANGLEGQWKIMTLEEKHRELFSVMRLEKWASFAVLMLVIMVALLSLAGSLAMTVIDKKHELFYLRCLGMERLQFMTIFIVEGGLTGLFGTALGSLLAWSLLKAQELYGFVQLPSQSAFIIKAYPVAMQPWDFVTVGVAAMVFTLLVSLYPAGKAAAIATSRSLEDKND
ncbi:MAG TPA: ABC transporter permease, partial [Chlorobaculum parvum]|nr:ABC transporter permease [Chlorobaculum parvum]